MARRLSGWLAMATIGASLCLCAGRTAAAEMTYVDLVKRLTDLEALAVLPRSGETCQQWSSYDRASKLRTGGHFIRDRYDVDKTGVGEPRRHRP